MALKLLTCPECHSAFRIDDSLMTDQGREVKCSKCGHQWLANRLDLRDDTISEHIAAERQVSADTPPVASDVEDDPLIGHMMRETEGAERVKADEAAWEAAEAEEAQKAENIAKAEDAETDAAPDDSEENDDASSDVIADIDSLFDPDIEASEEEHTPIDMDDDLEGLDGLADYDTQDRAEADALLEQQTRNRTLKRLLLVANVAAFLLATITALVAFRDSLDSPDGMLHSFYTAIGYEKTDQLSLANLTFTRNPSGEKRMRYVVRGSIVNRGETDMATPSIRARLFSEKGELFNEWVLTDENQTIPAGQSTKFTTKNLYSKAKDAHVLSLDIGSPVELMLRK